MIEKKKLLVSFSGGETSAYMAQWLWRHKRDEYELIFVFANTGQEHEETLKFIEKCQTYFGFPIVWIEAAPRVKYRGEIIDMSTDAFNLNWESGVGTSFRVVNFNSASREGHPFERVIQKFGIPNMTTPHCTRELKERPIKVYAKSIGWKDYFTAIGIRADEVDRVNPNHSTHKLLYPLVADIPMTKKKINFWWSQQPFRLNLKGHEGNCITCWKKADSKLFQTAIDNDRSFDWASKMEARYDKYVPESRLKLMAMRGEIPLLPVRFFRGNRSVADIISQSKTWNGTVLDTNQEYESCELFTEC